MRLSVLFCLVTTPALPQVAEPPLSFYEGTYRVIGTAADGAVDYALHLKEMDGGLAASRCGVGEAGGIMQLTYDDSPFFEGQIGGEDVTCEPFMNFDMYPVLLCYGDAGARLTLWPGNGFSEPLSCGG